MKFDGLSYGSFANVYKMPLSVPSYDPKQTSRPSVSSLFGIQTDSDDEENRRKGGVRKKESKVTYINVQEFINVSLHL